jgi:putative sterol carrier protein
MHPADTRLEAPGMPRPDVPIRRRGSLDEAAASPGPLAHGQARHQYPRVHRPFTPEWAESYCEAINSDEAFRQEAVRWNWPIAFILEATPALGYPAEVAVELVLKAGRCTGGRIVSVRKTSVPYQLKGSYQTWKALVTGELDPVTAVMKGELALVRGTVTALMMHARTARALINCARKVPTMFPDEV